MGGRPDPAGVGSWVIEAGEQTGVVGRVGAGEKREGQAGGVEEWKG